MPPATFPTECIMANLEITNLTLIGGAAIASYYMGHLAKKLRLPSLIGYMVMGVLLGSSGLGLFQHKQLEELVFITEIALGFVALSIGMELSLTSLKEQGKGIISIIISESFSAFIVVAGVVYLFSRDLPLALVFGSMAPASAPAGTVAVIHEYKAKGSLTKALYAVVGFDDGLAIIIFGFASALAKSILENEATGSSASILPGLLEAGKEIVLSILAGAVIGFIFCQMIRFVRDKRDMLVIAFCAVMIATGISTTYHLSLILTNMVIGFILVNTRKTELVHAVAAQMLNVMPLLFILFFMLAGAHLQIKALAALGVTGLVYVAGRTAGLIGGAWIGGLFGHVEDKIRKWIGLGILSQAGVAIGLSLIIKHDFASIPSEHAHRIGRSVITTITATCIFFELIGPILTKIALHKAGEIPDYLDTFA